MNRFDFLRQVSFFKNLVDEELRLVLSVCHEQSFHEGEVIFLEGDTADRFFIVMEGRVEVWKNYTQSRPDLLGFHDAGRFFGEMALVDDLPRSATVVAKDTVQVLFLYRDDFRSLLKEHSGIAISIMTSMSSLVRISNESYVDELRKHNAALELANEELRQAQTERLRDERLATLGKFSSMILHDIRNPISNLKGQISLIQMDPGDTERVRRYASAAEAEALKLERLAAEFLDYSRGETRLDIGIVEPARLIASVVSSVAWRLKADNIKLSIQSSAIGRAMLDYDRMQRALLNLVDNARKALLDVDNRSLRIQARYDDHHLVFEVEDTGIGMTPEIQEHIFEPFFSASGRGGTGLGLLIVRNIVESHGGTLSVRSSPGHGTSFYIRVPRRT